MSVVLLVAILIIGHAFFGLVRQKMLEREEESRRNSESEPDEQCGCPLDDEEFVSREKAP